MVNLDKVTIAGTIKAGFSDFHSSLEYSSEFCSATAKGKLTLTFIFRDKSALAYEYISGNITEVFLE